MPEEARDVSHRGGAPPDKLSVGGALELYSSFYRNPADWRALVQALGLDPEARRGTWDLISGIRDRGVTIVLVTHFMEETEHLCDRVALVDSGRIVALDTPAALAESIHAGMTVRFLAPAAFDTALLSALPDVTGVTRRGDTVTITGNGNVLAAVTTARPARPGRPPRLTPPCSRRSCRPARCPLPP